MTNTNIRHALLCQWRLVRILDEDGGKEGEISRGGAGRFARGRGNARGFSVSGLGQVAIYQTFVEFVSENNTMKSDQKKEIRINDFFSFLPIRRNAHGLPEMVHGLLVFLELE